MYSKRKKGVCNIVELDKEIRKHGLLKEPRDFQIDMRIEEFIKIFNKQVAPFLSYNIVREIIVTAVEEGATIYEKNGVLKFKITESNLRNEEKNINNFCAIILGKILKYISEEYHSHVVEKLALLTSLTAEPIPLESYA